MAWMTVGDAQVLSGIATINSNATALSFATWAINNGYCVRIAYQSEDAKLYDDNGISLTQKVSVTSYEFRGLERAFAENLATYLTSDNTVKWSYFGIDNNGDVQTVQVTESQADSTKRTVYYRLGGSTTWKNGGTIIVPNQTVTPQQMVCRASRSNEADGWRVSVTQTTYGHIEYTNKADRLGGVWFIPAPPSEAKNGITVSQNKTKVFVASDAGTPVYQNETTVVKEYRYLTATEAASKVSSEAASNSQTYDVRVVVSWGSGGTTYKNIQVRGGGTLGKTAATDKVATSRNVGGDQMWTVTVTETTYQVTTS